MRLLVTGGAGFIGSNFVISLTKGDLELPYSQISVLDRLTYASNIDFIQPLINTAKVNFIEGDICDSELISDLISTHDVVVNFAAETHVDNSIVDATQFVQSNILGVQTILTALKNYPTVRMLQISTDEVYGSIAKGSWDEKSPLQPNSPYSASKAAADLLIQAAHKTHNLDVLITRCSNNYGPRQHFEKLIPKLIQRALENKSLPLYGNGENIREWIYVLDHCKAIAWVIKNGKSGEIYNVGSSNEYSNIQIAKSILEKISSSQSQIKFIEDRPGHDFRYSLNDAKLRSKFSLKTSDFAESLEETIKWYRNTLYDVKEGEI